LIDSMDNPKLPVAFALARSMLSMTDRATKLNGIESMFSLHCCLVLGIGKFLAKMIDLASGANQCENYGNCDCQVCGVLILCKETVFKTLNVKIPKNFTLSMETAVQLCVILMSPDHQFLIKIFGDTKYFEKTQIFPGNVAKKLSKLDHVSSPTLAPLHIKRLFGLSIKSVFDKMVPYIIRNLCQYTKGNPKYQIKCMAFKSLKELFNINPGFFKMDTEAVNILGCVIESIEISLVTELAQKSVKQACLQLLSVILYSNEVDDSHKARVLLTLSNRFSIEDKQSIKILANNLRFLPVDRKEDICALIFMNLDEIDDSQQIAKLIVKFLEIDLELMHKVFACLSTDIHRELFIKSISDVSGMVKKCMENGYWLILEYFSVHRCLDILYLANDLIDIFLTSETSISSDKQLKSLVRILANILEKARHRFNDESLVIEKCLSYLSIKGSNIVRWVCKILAIIDKSIIANMDISDNQDRNIFIIACLLEYHDDISEYHEWIVSNITALVKLNCLGFISWNHLTLISDIDFRESLAIQLHENPVATISCLFYSLDNRSNDIQARIEIASKLITLPGIENILIQQFSSDVSGACIKLVNILFEDGFLNSVKYLPYLFYQIFRLKSQLLIKLVVKIIHSALNKQQTPNILFSGGLSKALDLLNEEKYETNANFMFGWNLILKGIKIKHAKIWETLILSVSKDKSVKLLEQIVIMASTLNKDADLSDLIDSCINKLTGEEFSSQVGACVIALNLIKTNLEGKHKNSLHHKSIDLQNAIDDLLSQPNPAEILLLGDIDVTSAVVARPAATPIVNIMKRKVVYKTPVRKRKRTLGLTKLEKQGNIDEDYDDDPNDEDY
jgi:hypothetical protein